MGVIALLGSGAAAAVLLPPVPGWLLAGAAGLLALGALLRRRPPAGLPPWILVDGSNVMYWLDGRPSLGTVHEVVGRLRELGFAPVVVFDANAGHLTAGRYLNGAELARRLGLPEGGVRVAPSGVQADPILLGSARDLAARIVTCDRYRDWVDSHPQVETPGLTIRGGYAKGALWLDIDPPPAPGRD